MIFLIIVTLLTLFNLKDKDTNLKDSDTAFMDISCSSFSSPDSRTALASLAIDSAITETAAS